MDSLSILIPDPSSPEESKHPGRAQTIQYLETLTARLLEHVSKHEWNHPDFETYVDADYTAYLEYAAQPVSRSRNEYIANYKAFAKINPHYQIQPISISADVNEKKGLASVWMHLRVGGHPANVWRESVTILYWRRKDGQWISYRQNGICGAAWFQ